MIRLSRVSLVMMDNTFDFEGEWARMIGGEIYRAAHPEFGRRLEIVRERLWKFNSLSPSASAERMDILRSLFAGCGENIHINSPFRCDWGCNIRIGERFFANFNLTILDEAQVTIGNDVFIGPNVSIYTACHPLDEVTRNTGAEWAEPVVIGDSVWIGGNAVILPGVTIGRGAVIGAGAVVTKNVEPYTVVAGNPARVIRRIEH